MRRWPHTVLAIAVVGVVALTGCSSTQDKAAALRAKGTALASSQHGLTISQPNKGVKVLGTTLLHDQNGDAVVVELRNNSKQTQVNVPILFEVRDAKGKTIYENNTPGIDLGLDHVPVIAPGQTFAWIDDQFKPSGIGKSVTVTVGTSSDKPPAHLPQLQVSSAKLRNDISGTEASGTVTNRSQVQQSRLIVFGVARQGGRIVAAGRAVLLIVKVGKQPTSYNIFFIGNPRGAQVSVSAPATVLK